MNLRKQLSSYIALNNYVEAIRGSQLPAGYTELEYIKSSGTQYIDIGIKGNETTKVHIKARYYTSSGAGGSGRVLGSRIAAAADAFAIGSASGTASTNSTVSFFFGNQNYLVTDKPIILDEWLDIVFDKMTHSINGVDYGNPYNDETFETPQNLKLFGFDNYGTIGVGYVDVAYCKLWDNGVLIRNLIPAKNSSGTIGMYDTISGTFFTNSGTGSFVAGPEVSSSFVVLTDAIRNGLTGLQLKGSEVKNKPETLFDSVTANGGCEQRNLPVEYTQLEYLESTGTQYIDTRIKQQDGDEFGLVYQQITLDTSYRSLFGAAVSGQTNEFYISQTSSTTYVGNISNNDIPRNTNKHTLSWVTTSSLSQNVVIDGQTYVISVQITPNPDLNVMVFARNANQDKMIGKVYGYYQKRNGEYLINLVPAKNSSGVVGMYDTVSGTFLTNAGTGTFTAGPNAVPTPDNPMDIYCNNGALKVRHQSGLPLDYTLLDYIESTGTQYIMTDTYLSDDNYEFFIEYDTSNITTKCLFGIQPGNPLFVLYNGSIYAQPTNTTPTNRVRNDVFSVGRHTLTVKTNNGVIEYKTDDGIATSYSLGTTTAFDASLFNVHPVGLFGYWNGGIIQTDRVLSGKIYRFYIKKNGSLVFNGFPVQHGNDIGMYDTVSGNFFTNAGTGDFIAGNVVNDLEIYVDNLVLAGKNLFDSSVFNTYVGDTITYTYHQIPNGTYTMSTNFPPQTGQIYTNVWIMSGIQTSGQSSDVNGVSLGNSKTITVTDGWYTVAYRSGIPAIPQDPKDYNWQLEKGSTATDYEPYSTKHKVETIQITGKNFFDAQWQQGIYNTSTGTHTPNVNNRICNVNMIQVKPSTNYTVSCPDYALASGMRWLFYDGNKNFISANTTGATTITTPTNAKYINFYIANNLTVDTAPDLQIEQSTTATSYEPYFDGGSAAAENLFGLDTYKDTQEVLSGNVTRNVGIKVLDGTEDWAYSSGWSDTTHKCFYVQLDDIKQQTNSSNECLCSHFEWYSRDDLYTDKTIIGGCISGYTPTNPESGKALTFRISSDAAADAAGFKQYLATQYVAGTPVIVVYPLATSTTESVSPQPLTYIDNYVLTIEDASISNPIVNAINSTHTVPTPDYPLDIICNNGVLRLSPNLIPDNFWNINRSRTMANGDLYTLQEAVATALVPVESNTTYVACYNGVANNARWYEYGENQTYIAGSYVADSKTLTTSSNTKYIAISFVNTQLKDVVSQEKYKLCSVNKGNIALPFVPYGQIYTDGIVETINVHGKNLLDVNNLQILKNKSISDTGAYVDNPATNICDTYISVKPNTVYTISGNVLSSNTGTSVVYFRLAYYDSNKTFISRSEGIEGQYYTFTTDSNTNYIKFHYANSMSDLNTYMLEEGVRPTKYEEYYQTSFAPEDLLKLGNYQDIQDVINGIKNKKIGVKVFDGTEDWGRNSYGDFGYRFYSILSKNRDWTVILKCNAYNGIPYQGGSSVGPNNTVFFAGITTTESGCFIRDDRFTTVNNWKQYLVKQYAAGTPVIIVYPLTDAVEETVESRDVFITSGTNTIERNSEYVSNGDITVEYKKLR